MALDEAGTESNFDDMLVEMDPGLAAHNYLKTWLPLDLVSGIPFMLINRLVAGGGCDDAELQGVGVSFNELLVLLRSSSGTDSYPSHKNSSIISRRSSVSSSPCASSAC